jgi:hypothetical protein
MLGWKSLNNSPLTATGLSACSDRFVEEPQLTLYRKLFGWAKERIGINLLWEYWHSECFAELSN